MTYVRIVVARTARVPHRESLASAPARIRSNSCAAKLPYMRNVTSRVTLYHVPKRLCTCRRCSGCLDTLFCNVNCSNEACASYHRWECAGNQMGLWQQIGVAHLGLKTLLKCTTTNDSGAFNSIQQLVTGFDNLSANDLIVYGIVSDIIYGRARAKR